MWLGLKDDISSCIGLVLLKKKHRLRKNFVIVQYRPNHLLMRP